MTATEISVQFIFKTLRTKLRRRRMLAAPFEGVAFLERPVWQPDTPPPIRQPVDESFVYTRCKSPKIPEVHFLNAVKTIDIYFAENQSKILRSKVKSVQTSLDYWIGLKLDDASARRPRLGRSQRLQHPRKRS